MRDKRFITEHRGGSLTNYGLVNVLKIFSLFTNTIDKRFSSAINVAKEWTKNNASVGDTKNASFGAIAIANELTNPIEIAIVRSVGHGVATAQYS